MDARLVTVALLLMAGTALPMTRRPAHPYRTEYKKETYGKKAVGRVAAGAAARHAIGHPHRHLAAGIGSALGAHVVKNSIQYGVAGIRHEDLHYHRSNKRGFGPRMKHALVSTVVTRKTTTGRRTAASGRISGAVGSGLAATAWQPAGFSAAGGAATGGLLLAGDAGANVAREFWPRKKRAHQRRVRH